MKSSQLHADTESSRLWDRIRKLEYDNNDAAARIHQLEADLLECRASSRNVPGNENGKNFPEKGKDFPSVPKFGAGV